MRYAIIQGSQPIIEKPSRRSSSDYQTTYISLNMDEAKANRCSREEMDDKAIDFWV